MHNWDFAIVTVAIIAAVGFVMYGFIQHTIRVATEDFEKELRMYIISNYRNEIVEEIARMVVDRICFEVEINDVGKQAKIAKTRKENY